MTGSAIPLVDLKAQHQEIATEINSALERLFATTAFVLGPEVKEFEEAFARFSGVPHCIGVANGTDAVEIAVRAAGIGAGDEVILPANTFIATALGVARAGATPVLADCDARYHLLDPERAAAHITPRTRALLPVHLYGQQAPMEAFTELARARKLLLLEDAAQAQGASRNGTGAGGWGLVTATSFFPGKNLGAYGDAGAVLTGSPEIAARVRALRNYGSDVKYHHPELGFNSRLDSIQALVLTAKLSRLAAWNEARRQAASRYDHLLAALPQVTRPETLAGNVHVFHLYVIRVPNRDQVMGRLQAAGIGAGVHYPTPIHLQGAFEHLGRKKGDFPVTEAASREILSLPLYPHLTAVQQERVVSELRKALA